MTFIYISTYFYDFFFPSDSKLEKLTYILKLIKKLLESVADWMIDKFNSISRNHRLVASTLEREMKAQKEKIQVDMNMLFMLYSCRERNAYTCMCIYTVYLFIFIQYSL